MEVPQPKAGVKTSEFYVTIVSNIVGILVLLGYLSPMQADEFISAIVSVIGGIMVIVSTATYLYGRIVLKREYMENSTVVSGVLNTPEADVGADSPSSKVIQYPL